MHKSILSFEIRFTWHTIDYSSKVSFLIKTYIEVEKKIPDKNKLHKELPHMYSPGNLFARSSIIKVMITIKDKKIETWNK